MLSYITLGAHDLVASRRFYDAVMIPLGYTATTDKDYEIAYAAPGEEPVLWIVKPYNDLPASYGNGTMICFHAPSRAAVDAFHAAALAAGGYDEGKPGLRSYGPNFYSCYVRDPAGNKLSIMCNKPA